MRAMVLRGKELAVEEVGRPEPGPGEVLCRVTACGVCGSDLHVALYAWDMQQEQRAKGMPLLGAMDLEAGVVMGHELAGEIVALGPGVEGWEVGARVTSLPVIQDASSASGYHTVGYSSRYPGGYGQYMVLGASMLLRIPENVSDAVASTTEPGSVGLHAVREAKLTKGERVLVMGAGPIGMMTLLWLKREGAGHVTVSEPSRERRELASKVGADLVVDPRSEDVAARMVEAGGEPTVVFECVGIEGTLQQAMELVARRGRVIVVGVCMVDDHFQPRVGIMKHLTMQFVLGCTPEEYAEVLAAFASGEVDPSPLITKRVGLDELPGAFRALSDPKDCLVVCAP